MPRHEKFGAKCGNGAAHTLLISGSRIWGKEGLFDLKICTSVTVTGGKMKMLRQDAVSGPRRQGRLVRRASFMLLMMFCLRQWVGAEVYDLQEIFQ